MIPLNDALGILMLVAVAIFCVGWFGRGTWERSADPEDDWTERDRAWKAEFSQAAWVETPPAERPDPEPPANCEYACSYDSQACILGPLHHEIHLCADDYMERVHTLEPDTDRMPTIAELADNAEYRLAWTELDGLVRGAHKWYEETWHTGSFRAVR